jgi:hypothetical protein
MPVMCAATPSENAAHHHLGAGQRHVGLENRGVVGRLEDRFRNVHAHLAGIYVHAHDELDIAGAITADPVMNESLRRIIRAIVGDSLHQ